MLDKTVKRYGKLAREWCKVVLPVQVLQSGAGFYLGTFDDEGPCSRESLEYWDTREQAQHALDTNQWNQRETP